MAPLRSYTNWGVRASDNEEQIEPRKSYYFICEGQNTERWYFEKFIDMRNDFGIHPLIAVEYLEKLTNIAHGLIPKNCSSWLSISKAIRI